MIGFIADYFNILGGAEKNDSVLLSHLRQKFDILQIVSSECTPEKVDKCECLIIGNFVQLPENMKDYIRNNSRYIIYEHDHKYVKTRDPSQFPEFKVPPEYLTNIDFYKGAKKVICLSQIQVDILSESAKLTNAISIGTSLWSLDDLSYMRELGKSSSKTRSAAIIKSHNPIKNTAKAEAFCQENDIDYETIQSNNYRQFLHSLSQYEKLVFFPAVLESLCRLVVEAKMLGCEVITTPKLLGASYEDWFSTSGLELISKIENKVCKALLVFDEVIAACISSPSSKQQDITAILTCYRRPEYLAEQISALKNQTIPPKEIWVWVNKHVDNSEYDFTDCGADCVFRNDRNWKFHARFALAQLARTRYVALFDDDTIPGEKWFENCLDSEAVSPGIYGGIGVVLNENRYQNHDRVGWSSPNNEIVEVDLVGHAWFFKKAYLQYMWKEEPYTWENGEDIQFSYLCKHYGDVRTYVPPHPKGSPAMFSSLKGYQYGVDLKASSRPSNHSVFYEQRDKQVVEYLNRGWVTVRGQKQDIQNRAGSK